MLVLSRKRTESIRIGDDIEIVIIDVGRNRVRVGIQCPTHIPVHREELLQMNFEGAKQAYRESVATERAVEA